MTEEEISEWERRQRERLAKEQEQLNEWRELETERLRLQVKVGKAELELREQEKKFREQEFDLITKANETKLKIEEARLGGLRECNNAFIGSHEATQKYFNYLRENKVPIIVG